jgi:uncharacterized protein (DUF2147 family)
MLRLITRALLAAITVIGIAVATVLPAGAQSADPNAVLGVWEEVNGDVKMAVFNEGGAFAARMLYGRLLVEADGSTFKKDTLNPDPSLRDRSLEGIVFISGLTFDPTNGRWEDGRFYSGSTGRTLSVRATMVDETLEMRAYMGTPAIGRTLVFRRAQ